MKKILTTAISAVAFLLAGSGAALAQDDESEKVTFSPIEAYACKFKEGKGWDDLRKVNEAWNAWEDERGTTDYVGAVMAPQYHSDLQSVDYIWVGGWENGNAMGAGLDAWVTEGQEIGKMYDEMSSCSGASTYVSMVMRPPKDDDGDEADNRFVVSFSNCSFKNEGDGVWDEFMAAQKEWNAYADEHGIAGSAYIWWPGAGETADADYDFKYIVGWDDHTMRGASWQKMADGHWRKNNDLFEDKLDCDSARIYNAWVVRNMGGDE